MSCRGCCLQSNGNLVMYLTMNGDDVAICRFPCGDQVPSHRLLLGLRSPVFFAMFYGDLAEKGTEVEIKDVDAVAFKEVVR